MNKKLSSAYKKYFIKTGLKKKELVSPTNVVTVYVFIMKQQLIILQVRT